MLRQAFKQRLFTIATLKIHRIINVVYQHVVNISMPLIFPTAHHFKLWHAFSLQPPMEAQTEEARIILAIEAIRSSKKINRHKAVELYRVPYSTLTNRINSRPPHSEYQPKNHNLTKLEEEVIV